jgi:hypothetical protein
MHLRALLFVALLVSHAHAQTSWTVTRSNVPGVTMLMGIAYGNGRFVATNLGGPAGAFVIWSNDGSTWQTGPVMPTGGDVFFFSGAFHVVSPAGVFRSSDGAQWQQIYAPVMAAPVVAAAHDGRGMMLVRMIPEGTMLISADLETWRTTAPLPHTGASGSSIYISAVAHGAGRYFVSYLVTPGGNLPPASYTASTVDGTSWTVIPALGGTAHLAGGGGRLVAISGTRSYVTTNGTTFSESPISNEEINPAGLFFAGGRFFAARTLRTSADGITWTSLAPSTKSPSVAIRGVAYGNGRYVAVGYDMPPPGSQYGIDFVAYISAAAAPLIATHPVGRTLPEGNQVTLSVVVENADTTTTFQWRRNGVAIPGANTATYTIATAAPADSGVFSVEIRNPLGMVLSEPAQLTVVPLAQAGRIINLSVLTSLDTPASDVTVGFVVGGAGTTETKALLVRAGGPSLAQFGVATPNPDPKLELFGPAGRIAENDDWGGAAVLAQAAVGVGAFPFLTADSRDAAVFSTTITPGDHTAKISANNSSGAVIAEVYDATPVDLITPATPRLINVSVRKQLQSGATISAGFVIGGLTPKTVLIRAVGPGLTAFGVAGAVANPSLTIFRTGTPAAIATNTDWGGAAGLRDAMDKVGAFLLAPASRDAALLLTLSPGNYVAQADADAAGGEVLVEVYDVP